MNSLKIDVLNEINSFKFMLLIFHLILSFLRFDFTFSVKKTSKDVFYRIFNKYVQWEKEIIELHFYLIQMNPFGRIILLKVKN